MFVFDDGVKIEYHKIIAEHVKGNENSIVLLCFVLCSIFLQSKK